MSGYADEGFDDEESSPAPQRASSSNNASGSLSGSNFHTSSGSSAYGAGGSIPDVAMDDRENYADMELAMQMSLQDPGQYQYAMMDEDLSAVNPRVHFGVSANQPDGDGLFQQKEVEIPRPPAEDLKFTVENATLDLDAYVGSHQGMIKTLRLLHVAKHCPTLRVDADKMLLKHLVEATQDVSTYQKVYEDLKNAIASGLTGEDGDANLPSLDETWVRESKRSFESRLDKLDHDLKNYKTNAIKESVRRGYDEIGNHYLVAGDATNALKSFGKARDYGEGLKEQMQTLANRLKACVYLGAFQNPPQLVQQMKDMQLSWERNVSLQKEPKSGDTNGLSLHRSANTAAHTSTTVDKKMENSWNLIRACMAVYQMSVARFKDAADLFVSLTPEHSDFPSVLTGRDIAVYGALCAVASYDRENLKEKIVNNRSFKSFMDTAPEIRRLVETFYNSNFSEFLRLFGDIKNNLLLDFLLARHVDSLYSQARQHGIIEFFRCFSSVSLKEMADEFLYSVPDLQDELTRMILDGKLNARIDSLNQVVVRNEPMIFMETAAKIQQDMEKLRDNMRVTLIRSSMLRAGISLRGSRGDEMPIGMP